QRITVTRGTGGNGSARGRRRPASSVAAAATRKSRSNPARQREKSMTEGDLNPNATTVSKDIDQTVERMEQLYRAVTGRDAPPPETEYAPIPAEKDPAEYVERRLNYLLELLGAAPQTARATAWIPPMSVWESDKEILIRLDLPGVPRDQVQVTAQDNVLTVSGTRRDSTDGFRER